MKKKKGGGVHTGVTDGHFNQWVPDSGNFTKPVVSKAPPITLYLGRDGELFVWTCSRCHTEIKTTRFVRPDHNCLDTKSDQ